jgi:hypothetical protein
MAPCAEETSRIPFRIGRQLGGFALVPPRGADDSYVSGCRCGDLEALPCQLGSNAPYDGSSGRLASGYPSDRRGGSGPGVRAREASRGRGVRRSI